MKTLATTLAVTAMATLLPLTACDANDSTPPSDTSSQTHTPSAPGSPDSGTPPPIAALEKQGVTVEGKFKAPNGLTGYAATIRNHPLAIYVMPDGQHAIVGTLIDAQGKDLSSEPLQRVASSQYQKIWPKLKSSHWVANGSDNAKRVVYEFVDANCPYCHKFWQESRPWVEAGQVQVREIVVGILTPTSMPKGATILAAKDPTAAFMKNERHYSRGESRGGGGGGITPLKNIPAEAKKKVEANNQMMQSLGFSATPTIVYRDDSDNVQVVQGVPQGDEMTAVMGGPKP
ncbi:MAG: thiol:disulfide interchange protein DsbG [Salinisphaera sp.]|jgi:thiol:disulfide interchange protein DsbG|nr:thiol:disulfide interchange protein DsbG [Salinisphaera sp.]